MSNIKLGWDKLRRLLSTPLTWTGVQTFTSLVATTADINAGTFDGVVGGTTPAAGTFSPVKAKGPAIITTFAGTVTATASTTVTFSSAADAILAGYSATNPMLGTTLISNALTRYIVSWTNATTCVVDSAVTWAGTAITSVQLPIAFEVNSSGVLIGYVTATGRVGLGTNSFLRSITIPNSSIIGSADGNAYFEFAGTTLNIDGYNSIVFITNAEAGRFTSTGNFLIGGLTAAGTTAAKVLGMASGTAPTTSPADAAQMWVADRGAVAGDAALHMRDEVGTNGPIAFATQRVITQAATDTLTLNEVMGTVISNYGQAAENTQTLPTAAAGLNGRVSISTTGAGAFHLKAGAGDKIYKDGSALDDGDKCTLASPAIGDCATFWTIQTGAAAWDWVFVSGVGLWIDGGS